MVISTGQKWKLQRFYWFQINKPDEQQFFVRRSLYASKRIQFYRNSFTNIYKSKLDV